MLREKLKHFKTIKLKRHHYVLGGFGIAAIVVFASIFGFQDIGTHAKEAEYPNITIPANNICTVINDTQVDVNGTGEINIYCKLGACHEEGEVIPNSILGGYNEKINISSMGNAVCLAACSSEKETNCIEANKLSQLQYDNIFTFTFEGISAGTSDIKLLANSFEGNNEADGQQITVNQSNNTYSVSCNWQTDTPGVDAGERGTIDLYCGAADLPLFSDLRSIITITNNDNETINPKEITQGEWDNENETRYVLSFLGNRSGFVNLQINGTLYDKGDSYTFIDKNIGTVKVNGKSAQSGGPDCSIYGDSPVNLNNEGTITLTCKGKKLGYINENLKAQTALDYSGNIEVKSEPEEIIPSDSSITIKYTFTGIVEGTGHLKLNEGIIIEEGSTPNGAVEGNEISVIDNTNNVICKWLDGGKTSIDVGEIGSLVLSCNLENIHLKPELLQVEDGTKLEITKFINTGNTNNDGWYHYEVQYKGNNEGETKLIIGGEYSNEYIIPETKSPTIKVNNKEVEPLDCSIIATGDTVYVNETGKIVVTCETKMVKNEILNSSDLDYSGYIIEVQPTANRQLGNAGVFTYEFEYTGKRTPHTYLKLRAGVLFDSDTNATNEEQEYINGITVLEQISVDPIKCDIIATGHTVYINETGNIVVTCDGTGYSDLTNTGLDYSGNITVSTNSDKQEESNKTKYTFTYTGDIAGRSHLKLLTNAIGNTPNGSTPATFATGITVLENIPDCNPNWDNNKFITPEFWKLDPAPTDPQIACALYGSGGDDQTAYTMGWNGYQGGTSCPLYSSMNVVSGATLPSSLSENTIYVITSTGFTTSNEIVLPKCSAIISNQIDGKDAVIKTTNSNMGIAINKSYGILDNISVHGIDGNIGILVQGQSNTLNVVKVYNRKKGIFVDRGIHNLLNNIQSYGNQNGIHVKAENNAINNTQIYRNDIGLDVDHSTNNIVYNTEIYQNKTGLNVGQLSSNNTFDSIEFVANDLNLYVLSGLESQNYAKWLLMGPLPITKVYEFEDIPLDEYSNLTSVLSGFDRVLLRSDLERSYIFECEGGPSATYKYTGNNQIDLTLTAGEICNGESMGDYLGRYTMRTGRTDGIIIETRPLLTANGSALSYSSSYVYPNNTTNPQYINGIYLNNWYIVHKGHAQIDNNIQSYSYGYDIKTQKDVKLRDNNIGGEVNGKYFIGSNVQKYEISGNIGKHTKVHYTITGTAIDTSEIKKYNIYQIPQNIHSTIDRYIGPTRTKHTLTGRINQIKEIDINSGVEIYIETGDTSSYPVIVQMYGEGEIGPERNDYFAEHRYIGALTRQAPTFEIQPGNMCTKEEIINMTGTWTGFEYNMTGFDFDDITVTGYASRVTGSFAPGTRTGVYTRKISLSGGEGRVYVVGNTSEDILEFGNAQSEIRIYNRDIYAPEIETEGFTIPECTGKILDIEAQDVGCKGMKDYKLEGALGNIGWQNSSIFQINETIIGRTGGITKTGLIYARDGFNNTKTGIIVGTITNIPPTITSGQTQEAPYEYGTITGETIISQSDIITMLGANEGACGIADLSIESVSCDSNAQGTLLSDGGIKIRPLYNNDTICNVVIKDNEDNEEYSRVTGYIKFRASNIPGITVTIIPNDSNSGTVEPTSLSVGYGTNIIINDNTLNIGGTTVTATPSQATEQYNFSFVDWTNGCEEVVTESCIITGNFQSTPRKYTVTFVDEDGTTILKEATEYDYGTPAEDIVKPEDPTKPSTAQYTYTFAGWNPSISDVTEDAVYQATYQEIGVNQYIVTFYDEDGQTVLDTQVVDYGEDATYGGETPTKPSTEQYAYSFDNWYTAIEGGDIDNLTNVIANRNVYARYTQSTRKYTVTFVDEDGTTVLKEATEYDYGTPAADIVKPENPTKPSTAQYNYIFAGWTPTVSDVTEDVTYTATYTQSTRKYTVTFVDEDGTTILKEATEYDYGTPAADIVKPENPTKPSTAQYNYIFAGWNPSVSDVTEDVTYTATYTSTTRSYTVTWKNSDGEILETDTEVEYGTMPSYDGQTPTSGGDAQYSYEFNGWSPTISEVNGNQTYIAQYTQSVNKYTVTFVDEDGTTILKEATEYDYGTPAADIVKPATPTKPATAQYTYTFAGWNPSVSDVTEDAVYQATYQEIGVNQYIVTFYDEDGQTVLDTQVVDYGEDATYGGETPTKPSTEQYAYSFDNWYTAIEGGDIDNLTNVIANRNVYARYTSTTRSYTVTWKNSDGEILETDTEVEYGTMPSYDGQTPTSGGDVQYSYEFNGWSPTISEVNGNQTYIAQYTQSTNTYLIIFKNWDGTELQSGMVEYGTTPTYNGTTPTKEDGYEFNGWSPAIQTVIGTQIYTATYVDIQDPTGDIIITYLSGQLTNGCTSGNVKLTLTGIDNNELAEEPYKWNDGNWTTNNTKIITENEKGTGYIRDAAGNITGIVYDITGISQTGPTISLNTPYSGAVLTGFVHFEWGVVASNSICQALSGGYNIAVYSGTEEVYTRNTGSTTIDTTLPEGTYTWNVSTTDILGHISKSETRPFIIRTGASTCAIEYIPAADLGWTSGDVQSILTGCSAGATGFNATGHLFTGNTTYEFTFTNEYGITGNAIADVWRIDKEPPVLHEIVPIGITTDTTPDYTFSSTESGTITYSGSCSSIAIQAISGNNTITLNALAIGTYSNCYIMVTDKAGNIGRLHMSEFTIRNNNSGPSSPTLTKDNCPDGDYSDSYYDGTCEGSHKSDETRDICKVNESNYSDEMKLAYLYAYVHGMTTMCPIDDADLYGYLRRDHLAKILTQYSINVLDLEPEVGKAGCNDFDDIANESAEMKYFIRTSCELGLMGLESDGKTPKKSFDPTKYVTRAEFGTTLSRLIYEGKYNLASEAENTYPGAWYSKHLQALKKAEIMNEIDGDRPQHIELRGYVMLMVMRYGKGRLADMVTDENANSYYMNNIYTKGNKEMSCTVYSGGKKIGDLYIEGNDIKEYNKTSGVSVLIKNKVLYTRSDSSKKGVSKKYTISVFNFLKKFDDEEISVQCTQGVDSDELIKPKNITFLSV